MSFLYDALKGERGQHEYELFVLLAHVLSLKQIHEL